MPRRSPNALCFPRVRAWLSEGDLPERMPRFRCPTGTECCCHQTRARGPKSREEGTVTGEQGRRGGTGHAEACDIPPSRLPRWRYTPQDPGQGQISGGRRMWQLNHKALEPTNWPSLVCSNAVRLGGDIWRSYFDSATIGHDVMPSSFEMASRVCLWLKIVSSIQSRRKASHKEHTGQ